jgi:hypothetical protein
MSVFAVILLIALVPKGSLSGFVCDYLGMDGISGRLCPNLQPAAPTGTVASRIDSACVDAQGLKIAITFDPAVTGEAQIQVFSTGPDFFPSARGLTDTYETSRTLTTATDQMELVIPVESMPVGEQLFGNVLMSGEGNSSYLAYLLNVSDCAAAGAPLTNPAVAALPTIASATCLPSQELMIALEFDSPVLGQYQALVADRPYQLASVVTQPATLFFSGESPPAGPIVVRLVSALDKNVVFEGAYDAPGCGGG